MGRLFFRSGCKRRRCGCVSSSFLTIGSGGLFGSFNRLGRRPCCRLQVELSGLKANRPVFSEFVRSTPEGLSCSCPKSGGLHL
jgi:hypothetical protein